MNFTQKTAAKIKTTASGKQFYKIIIGHQL